MSKVSIQGVRSNGNVIMVDPAKIQIVENYNVRDNFDTTNEPDDAALYGSILANGFQSDKPLVVRIIGTAIYLVAGHRRLAAVMQARKNGAVIKEVATILEGAGQAGKVRTDAERMADIVLSNSGKPLSLPEKAAILLRLRRYGWKDLQIAEKFGMTDKWVRETIKVTTLDDRLKALVKANVISPTLAVEMTADHGAKGAADIAEKALANAPKTGARAGKVTGAVVTAVTGKPGKAEAKAARVQAGKPAVTTQVPEKPTAKVLSSVPTAKLAGPFSLGKDMDDSAMFDAGGNLLCEFADPGIARAMLMLVNQGWHTFAGKSVPTAPAVEPVTAKAGTAKVEPVKAPATAPAKAKVAPVKAPATVPAKAIANVPATAMPGLVTVVKELASIGAVLADKAKAKAGTVARKGR